MKTVFETVSTLLEECVATIVESLDEPVSFEFLTAVLGIPQMGPGSGGDERSPVGALTGEKRENRLVGRAHPIECW